jgi:cold shock CspA family protein
MNDDRLIGLLIKWDSKRGFGFIRVQGEKRDGFLQNKRLRPEHRASVEIGNALSFVLLRTERGIEALEPLLTEQHSEAS